MTKLTTLLKLLASLRSRGNRAQFVKAMRNYMNDVQHANSLSMRTDSPYRNINPGTSKILLVVPDFSRTGVPYAALFLARALTSLHGTPPTVLANDAGPLRAAFNQMGCATIVDTLLFEYRAYSPDVCHFVSRFDRVIVLSLASFGFVRHFRGVAKRLSWWIHETSTSLYAEINKSADLSLLCTACESLWLGSPLCFDKLKQYAPPDKLHLLLYGCDDAAVQHRASGKIVFSIIGSIEQRKGQDIFLDAIELLPPDLRHQAIFRIIGSPLFDQASQAYFENVSHIASRFAEVELHDNMPMEMLRNFLAENDVLVSASRDDPMPITVTEGLMNSNVCLCSSAIGHAGLLKDGESGLIFRSESAQNLAEKISWILRNSAEAADMGKAGRAIYEKHFLMGRFIANLSNLLDRA